MKREKVKEQVMKRVGNVTLANEGKAHEALNAWVGAYPLKYVFGVREVLAGERLVRRELGVR